jgi:hypothetical protein
MNSAALIRRGLITAVRRAFRAGVGKIWLISSICKATARLESSAATADSTSDHDGPGGPSY